MQALLLSAGASSRFFPFNLKHKSLVKIAGEEIIVHTIRAIKRYGITDIVIAVSNKTDFQQVLQNGKKYGVKIRYIIYPEAEGAGETVLRAASLIDSDFFLVNSNNVGFDLLAAKIDTKRKTNSEIVLLGRESTGASHLGILKTEGDRVIELVEKPVSTKGLPNLRVVGVYFLNQEFIKILKKEKKDHYSLESAINSFAKLGKVKYAVVTEYFSLKYPWDLLSLKNYILGKLTRSISSKANISKHAIIEGNVVIESGATILENAVIKGPAYIGKDAFIGSNTLVREASDIEEGSVVGGYMEVKNSLIMSSSKTHSGHFEDSIMGENSRLGALFTSANVKLDRKNIESVVKGKKIDTNFRSLGAIIGSDVRIGVRVSTMPGVIIGNKVNIGPSTTVMKNIDSDTTYYTKFKEVVEKRKGSQVKGEK